MSRVLQTTLQGIVTLISCFGLAGCGLLFPYPANYSPYSPYGQPYPGQPYPTAPGYGTPQYPASPGYPAYPGYNSPGYPVTPGYPSGRPGGPPITWNPVTPIGSPSPFGPIVLNPQPSGPVLKPVTNPTDQPVPIPGGNNAPPNVVPPTGDVTAEWAAWPLPPRRQPAIAQGSGILNSTGPKNTSASPDGADGFQLINDGTPSPAEDLQYHGGKTLQNIEYVNLYIGGDEVWD